jgi:hypothetical protein
MVVDDKGRGLRYDDGSGKLFVWLVLPLSTQSTKPLDKSYTHDVMGTLHCTA